MYKHAVGLQLDQRIEKALPRWLIRRYYYRHIEKLGDEFSQRYEKAPAWLLEEVKTYTPRLWLDHWGPNGQRRIRRAARWFRNSN